MSLVDLQKFAVTDCDSVRNPDTPGGTRTNREEYTIWQVLAHLPDEGAAAGQAQARAGGARHAAGTDRLLHAASLLRPRGSGPWRWEPISGKPETPLVPDGPERLEVLHVLRGVAMRLRSGAFPSVQECPRDIKMCRVM